MTHARNAGSAFDIAEVGGFYVANKFLTEGQFDKLFSDAMGIRDLEIDGLDWVLFDHVLSTYRSIPLSGHIRALAAGLGLPYRGIEAFYEAAIERKLLPRHMLNGLLMAHQPRRGLPLGALLVEMGSVRPAEVQRALGIQALIRRATGTDPALGQILRSLCDLSVVQLFQALSIQTAIPFESLDASADEIYDAVFRQGQ